MLKPYTAPRLTPKGEVVEVTRTIMSGQGDPDGRLKDASVGSLGFLL